MGIPPYTVWQTIRSLTVVPTIVVSSWLALRLFANMIGLLQFIVFCILIVAVVEILTWLRRKQSGRVAYYTIRIVPLLLVFYIELLGPLILVATCLRRCTHATWHLQLAIVRIGNQVGNTAKHIEFALHHVEQAHTIYTQVGDALHIAATHTFKAQLLLRRLRGDHAVSLVQAMVACDKALAISEYTQYPLLHAKTLQTLAGAYAHRHQHEQALPLLEQADNLLQATPNHLPGFPKHLTKALQPLPLPVEQAKIAFDLGLNTMLHVDTSSYRYAQAQAYFERSAQVLSPHERPFDWADSARHLASIYAEHTSDDPQTNILRAITYSRSAIQYLPREAFPRRWAETMYRLGYSYHRLFQLGETDAWEQAVACYWQALDILTPDTFPYACRLTAINLGSLLYGQGDYHAARWALEIAHRAALSLRGDMTRNAAKQQLSADHVDLYTALIDCCMHEDDIEGAFTYAVAGKARTFVDQLASVPIDLMALGQRHPEIAQELTHITHLRQQIDTLMTMLTSGNTHNDEHAISIQLRQLQVHEREHWQHISLRHPEVTATQQAPELAPARACQLAGDLNAVLVEYFYFAARGIWAAFVVTDQEIRYISLPLVTPALLQQLEQWRQQVADTSINIQRPALRYWIPEKWYKALIEPLDIATYPQPNLVLAPAGQLHLLPFGAAYSESGTYLAEEYVLATTPSISALDVAYRRTTPGASSPTRSPASNRRLLSVVYPGNDPASKHYLKQALNEASTIAQQFDCAHVQMLQDHDATPAQVLAYATDRDIVHFACHGWFDSYYPEQSGLLLANGVLTVGRIVTHLQLQQAMLATLSACDSGRVGIEQGDELVGLTQAMLTAGARAVVASLWPINDAATARLFEVFYQELNQGIAPALALQQAVSVLRRDQNLDHPYYWAAFQVSGIAFS